MLVEVVDRGLADHLRVEGLSGRQPNDPVDDTAPEDDAPLDRLVHEPARVVRAEEADLAEEGAAQHLAPIPAVALLESPRAGKDEREPLLAVDQPGEEQEDVGIQASLLDLRLEQLVLVDEDQQRAVLDACEHAVE